MGLFVGSTPVKQVYVGGTPVTAVYVGAVKVWPTAVQITLGADLEARDQFRAALAEWGLDYATVSEIPFGIELVGTGSAQDMFRGCAALMSVPDMDTSGVTNMRSMFNACNALTSVPPMDTSQVTNMAWMFTHCYALTTIPAMDTSQVTAMNSMFDQCPSLISVPDMDTSNVTNMGAMFYNCAALTDGNVRLIGRNPSVNTSNMITGSGLTREPWYNADGTPLDPIEVHEVSLTNVQGTNTVHSLVSATVPAGETWSVRIQGTVTKAPTSSSSQPWFRIGTANSGRYGNNKTVNYSGTITSSNSTIAMVTAGTFSLGQASFTGTVTIEK